MPLSTHSQRVCHSVEARAMCIKARDGMIQSLARRGEAERRFEEDDQLEDEDYEVIFRICVG